MIYWSHGDNSLLYQSINDHFKGQFDWTTKYGEVGYRKIHTFYHGTIENGWILLVSRVGRKIVLDFPPLESIKDTPNLEIEGKTHFKVEHVNYPLRNFKVPSFIRVFGFFYDLKDENLHKYLSYFDQFLQQHPAITQKSINEVAFGYTTDKRLQHCYQSDLSKYALSLNENCDPELLDELALDGSEAVLNNLPLQQKLTSGQQKQIVQNKNASLNTFRQLSKRDDLNQDVIDFLINKQDHITNSYLQGLNTVQILTDFGSADRLLPIAAFIKYILNEPTELKITKSNRFLSQYFERKDTLSSEEFIQTATNNFLYSKSINGFLNHLFIGDITLNRFRHLKQIIERSYHNMMSFKSQNISPFSFRVNYDLYLNHSKPDLDFNLVLEMDERLYYPKKIFSEYLKSSMNYLLHVEDSIAWCLGRVFEQRGKRSLFIFEMQSDLVPGGNSKIKEHFKDWHKVLLMVIIQEAQKREIDDLYIVPAEQIRKYWKVEHSEDKASTWDKIYDDYPQSLGMTLKKTDIPIDISLYTYSRFEIDRFYHASLSSLPCIELQNTPY